MRRALSVLGVLTILTTFLVAGPVTAQTQTQPGPWVVEDDDTDAPSFVTGLDERTLRGRPAELALSHLSANRSLYAIDAPSTDLDVLSVDRSDEQSTVRFQQLYKGVEVFGAHYLVHFDERGAGREVTAVNGNYFTDLNTSVEARISETAAQRLALVRLRGVKVAGLESHGLVVLPDGGGVTAFRFTIWGHGPKGPIKQEIFISAQTGAPVLSYNDLHRADPVIGSGETVHGGTVDLSLFQNDEFLYEMRGSLDPNEEPPPPIPLEPVQITTHNAGGQDGLSFEPSDETVISHSVPHFDGSFTDIGAVDAHWGTERVFEFYKSLGRNSIDNEGMDIVSVVNGGDAGDSPMYNAFWDGSKMVYGNPEPGPGGEVHPFSADLDIVAHELTHGVIDHSADLVYLNQSGAMNEAYADYFGNAVDVTVSGTAMDDPEAGYIAEDLCRVQDPANWECPLRDMNDERGVEDFEFYLVDFDNGGVHLNSTIFSGALWDIREDLEPEVADELMYRAMTQFGHPLQDFFDGRVAVVAAANHMELSDEQLAVINEAFDSRGIVNGWDDSPGESDSMSLLQDIVPLGFYHGAPQVSGSRYVVGNYADKGAIFEERQDIVVGKVSGSGTISTVNDNAESNVLYDELPDISGDQVVWTRGLIEGGELAFDVVSRQLDGKMRTISDDPQAEWFPSIDGNLVAWESWNGEQTNIWARRIGKLPKQITNSKGDEFYPQVSGNKIAWRNGGANKIGIKDFKTGAKTTIKHSNPDAYLGPPALNNKYVFWFQDPNNDGTGAIMRANLNGKKKVALVPQSHSVAPFYDALTPEPPHISANNKNLVYVDEYGYSRQGDEDYNPHYVGRDVWLIPVGGGDPKLVTCNRGDQGYPSMGNDQTTVWLDGSLGRTDLMTRSEPLTCRLGDARSAGN